MQLIMEKKSGGMDKKISCRCFFLGFYLSEEIFRIASL